MLIFLICVDSSGGERLKKTKKINKMKILSNEAKKDQKNFLFPSLSFDKCTYMFIVMSRLVQQYACCLASPENRSRHNPQETQDTQDAQDAQDAQETQETQDMHGT